MTFMELKAKVNEILRANFDRYGAEHYAGKITLFERIPEEALESAIGSYASEIYANGDDGSIFSDEVIIALIDWNKSKDSGFLHKAKRLFSEDEDSGGLGILLTTKRLFCEDVDSEGVINISDIEDIRVGKTMSEYVIGRGDFSLLFEKDKELIELESEWCCTGYIVDFLLPVVSLLKNIDASKLSTTKRCQNCWQSNNKNIKICAGCGKDVDIKTDKTDAASANASTKKCSRCSTVVSANVKFCTNCGNDTTINPVAAPPSNTITCRKCGATAATNYKFCPECGEPKEIKCKGCGFAIDGNPKFCPECGFKI